MDANNQLRELFFACELEKKNVLVRFIEANGKLENIESPIVHTRIRSALIFMGEEENIKFDVKAYLEFAENLDKENKMIQEEVKKYKDLAGVKNDQLVFE